MHDAHNELDQYECQVPSVESARADPGTETRRLITKPFNMTLRADAAAGYLRHDGRGQARDPIGAVSSHRVAPEIANRRT